MSRTRKNTISEIQKNLATYERLKNSARNLIEQLLLKNGINFLTVTGRAKAIDSIQKKIKVKNYRDPMNQITDFVGIRVVVFLNSDENQVGRLLADTFEIDQENSSDRAGSLGSDRVGYRSRHFVCQLGKDRCKLAEYKDFENLKFEVQVRTVLQHAWAELAHDNSYKFEMGLPAEITRKLNLYSGLLEIADGGFQEIVLEIEKYKSDLGKTLKSALKDYEINLITVSKFADDLEKKAGFAIGRVLAGYPKVMEEVQKFGWKTIGDLEAALNVSDLQQLYSGRPHRINEIGILRDLMMIENFDKYFADVYDRDWEVWDWKDVKFFSEKVGAKKVQDVMKKFGIDADDFDDDAVPPVVPADKGSIQ